MKKYLTLLEYLANGTVGNQTLLEYYVLERTRGSADTLSYTEGGCSHLEILTGLVGLLLLVSETLAFSKCEINGIGHWIYEFLKKIMLTKKTG